VKAASKPRVIVPRPPITEIIWVMADKQAFKCPVIPDACSTCGRRRIVVLPPPMAAQQTDGTTHVCHPSIGGCNQGFELTGPFAQAVLQ
jgi:hypothetical protein